MTRMLDVLEQFLNYHGHIYLRLDGSTRVEQRQVGADVYQRWGLQSNERTQVRLKWAISEVGSLLGQNLGVTWPWLDHTPEFI